MRARNSKPSFFKDERLADLPPHDRLLYKGLECMADRDGRLENRPRRIKAEIFPYEDVDVAPMLDRLSGIGMIVRYSSSGKECIWLPEFHLDQNPHKNEQESELPEYKEDEHGTTISGVSRNLCETKTVAHGLIPSSLIPDSLVLTSEHPTRSRDKSKQENPVVSRVIAHLNAKAGTHFSPKSAAHQKFILARLEDGASVEELLSVIDMKVAEWGNSAEMFPRLCPKTLFNATNFDNYRGMIGTVKASPPRIEAPVEMTPEQKEAWYARIDAEEAAARARRSANV